MNLKGKDFLTLIDYDKESIFYLLDLAKTLKQEIKTQKFSQILENKILAMIFEKPSLRTRMSFEAGIQQLGGKAIVLKNDEIGFNSRESVADIARTVSRYADGVMIRTFAQNNVAEFAKWADIPIINGLTDDSHPCQILADLLTIKEKFGDFNNIKLAYVGDGNNIANSLLIGCSIAGINITIGCPKDYEPKQSYIEKSKELACESGTFVKIVNDPNIAVEEANIIYTDVWTSMGQEKEKQQRKEIFKSYQVNKELLKRASNDVIILHCLPAHRDEEITNEIFEKYAQIIFNQAENRLHAQKAIMASII
ncbi:MAG: ornithine carbamoyltransferase [bacterium]